MGHGTTTKLLWVVLLGYAIGVTVAPLVGASRNASGTYSLPAGNPVVTGTAISSTAYNNTNSDIATELTDSLSRSGKGAMTAALELANGTVGAPGLSFDSDTDCGLYRIGTNNVGLSIAGVKTVDYSSASTGFSTAVSAVGVKSTDGGYFQGGAADTAGLVSIGTGTGQGVKATGGASNGDGVWGTGGATNGKGVVGFGTGSGTGGHFVGGATGLAVSGTGGATSGNGGTFTATSGNAVEGTTASGNGGAFTGVGAAQYGVVGTNLTGRACACLGDPTTPAIAALHVLPQDAAPSGASIVGDMYVTTAGVLKICTVAGTGGGATWVSVGAQ